jgi:hypothetical protein
MLIKDVACSLHTCSTDSSIRLLFIESVRPWIDETILQLSVILRLDSYSSDAWERSLLYTVRNGTEVKKFTPFAEGLQYNIA